MKPTLRQRRILRKLTTPMDPDAHIQDDEAYLRAKMERFKSSGWNKPRPSFLRYLINRNGFGRWRWWEFALLEFVCLVFVIWGTIINHGGAFGIVWPVIINVVVVYWHYLQYKTMP